MPMAFLSNTTLLDDFTGNENPISGWTSLTGNNHQQTGGQLAGTTVDVVHWSYITALLSVFGPAQDFAIIVPTKPSGDGHYIGLTPRLHDPTVDGYAFLAQNQTGTDNLRLYRIDNGGFTGLGAGNVAQEYSAGDWFGIRCEGSTITLYRSTDGGATWTSIQSVTDATYAPAASTCAVLQLSTASRLDDFRGGHIAGGPLIAHGPIAGPGWFMGGRIIG